MISTKSTDPYEVFNYGYRENLYRADEKGASEYLKFFQDKLDKAAQAKQQEVYNKAMLTIQEPKEQETSMTKIDEIDEIDGKDETDGIDGKDILNKKEMFNILKEKGIIVHHATGKQKLLQLCKENKLV